MSGMYLSRISLRDFRTFGNFDIDIPAAPGLTILTGTNGLGKSNFFDAVEWALTGKVRRFSQYVEKRQLPEQEYLTRMGAVPDSHQVHLRFSDGTQVERSRARATPMREIIAKLAQTDKSTIHDLDIYLAFTHFLGQSSEQRFTSREAQEQWRALRGPRGIDRLENVREGIKKRAITIAFTRRKKDEESAIGQIELKIAEWEGWQTRRERLLQALRAAGALTPEDLQQRISTLETAIFGVLKEAAPAIEGEASAQRLARFAGHITVALQQLAERANTIESFSDAVDQFATASVIARMDNPLVVRARKDVESARSATAELGPKGERAQANLAAQSSAIRNLEQDIAVLEAVRSDLSRKQDIAAQVLTAEAEQSRFLAEIAIRRDAVVAAEAEVRQHAEAIAEVARVRSNADKAHSLIESHTGLLQLDGVVTQNASALAHAQLLASDAKQDLEAAVSARDILDERLKLATNAHVNAQRQGNAISAAVVAIASHIGHDDTNCPVCRTEFAAGQLKLLVDEVAKSTNDGLAKLAAEIEGLRAETASISARIVWLQGIVDAPAQLERTWKTNRDIAARARTALALALGVEVSADLSTASSTREQSSVLELKVADARQDELAAPAAAAAERRLAFTSEIEALVAQQGQVLANLSALRSEEKACSERVVARGMASQSIDNVSTRLSEQRASLEGARAQLNQLTEVASINRSQLDAAMQAFAAAERALAEAESARVNAEETEKQLKLRWTRSSLVGLPSRVAMENALSAVQSDAVSLRKLQGNLQELARDNQDLLLKNELDEVDAAIKHEGGESGFSKPKVHLEELKSKHAKAIAALELTNESQQAVNSFAKSLQSNVEEYSSKVLVPLNGVICDFNKAMLSSPGQSIQFKATHRVDSTAFGMSLQNRPAPELEMGQTEDIPPQVMLSEGQLAANGFSILCAASTAYPWSRWRALLLDDPLQHNDIIHTAAFIDVMRNLVELEGYQLIMSSHDKGESEFIARKFDAAGLPCSRIVLSGPSNHGVLYEEPEHNQAAKAVMQRGNPRATAAAN